MGWYGGQEGAKRLRYREATSAAVRRWRSALPRSVQQSQSEHSIIEFELQDNADFDKVQSLVYNPLSQDEIVTKMNNTQVAATNEKDEDSGGGLAVSIISSWYLKDLSGVTDAVCERLKGLVLYGNPNLPKEAIKDFLARCPVIECLVLANDVPAPYVATIFQQCALQQLRFLEVSDANDHAVAAMKTAPHLQQLIVRSYGPGLTNEGFGRLIEQGGGHELAAVTCNIVKSSRPLCKTVSKNYLMARLPVFLAGKGKDKCLIHMVVGKKVKPLPQADQDAAAAKAKLLTSDAAEKATLLAATAATPVAAVAAAAVAVEAMVPVEVMTYTQLEAALKHRGVSVQSLLASEQNTASLRELLSDINFGYGYTILPEETTAVLPVPAGQPAAAETSASSSSSKPGATITSKKRPLASSAVNSRFPSPKQSRN
jgi:hypothetical protein